MHAYTCDKCKKPLYYPVYTMTVLYGPQTQNEQHFHWQCLKQYMEEAS